MALALDVSTPVAVTQTTSIAAGATGTFTTASFTPPAGAILIVILCSNSGTSSITLSNFAVTDNLGAHLTYSLVKQVGNLSNDAQTTVWSSSSIGTSAAMTVSASYKNSGSASDTGTPTLLRVLVITGADTTAPIGANGGARGRTTNVNTSYSSTVNGSWGWMGYADWSASGIPSVPAGEAVDSSYNVSGQDSYAVIKQTSTTASAGTSVTMSTSTPSSGTQISYVYFEIVPPSGGTLFTQNLSDSVTLAEDIAKASARSLSDPISLGESIARQTGKLLADPYSLSDSISRNIGKAVTDPFSLADSIARSPARGLTETFSVTDSLAKQAARVLSDAFSLSDALSAIKTKVLALSDTFSLSDTLARQTGKSLADAVTIAETFFRSTTLALADTFTLSEAFSAIKTKILNLSDAFTVSDGLARANAKLLVDPVTVTDHAIQANITPLHPVLSDQNTYIGTGFAEWGSIFNPNIGGG